MFFIESARLKLIPLTHQLLQLCHKNRPAMEQSLGLNISAMQIPALYKAELDDAMQHFWLPKTLEHPDKYMWYTNWEIILKQTHTSIGGIGFAGYRNNDGEVETGYMIDAQQQRKGYATEALQTIISWAFTHADVRAITAHTYADNLASQRTLLKNGFVVVNETDGLLKFRLNN